MDNEEKEYKQLKKLGQKLHIPIPEAFLELEVRDRDGRVIQKHKQRSHSWVRNAYNMLFGQLAGKDLKDTTFGAGLLSIKDTDGTIRYDGATYFGRKDTTLTNSLDGTSLGYKAPAGNDTKGIIVGSGTNAESFEDHTLQTKIANGTGAGQLSYVQSELHVISYDAGTKVLKNSLVRYFNNNSGGDVSVNEVGIVGYGSVYLTYCSWLMSRDKLATTVTVPNTGQLKVTYIVQLTFPA